MLGERPIRRLLARHDHETVARLLGALPRRLLDDIQTAALSRALGRLGRQDEEVELLEEAVSRGAYPRSLRALLRVRCRRGEHDRAVALLERAILARPACGWYRLALGDVLWLDARDPCRALAVYREALAREERRSGEDASTYCYILKRISRLCSDTGRLGEAIPALEELRSLSIARFFESDYVRLGRCYEAKQELDRALDTWEQGTQKRRGRLCLRELERVAPERARRCILPAAPRPLPGVLRIPLETGLVTEDHDAPRLVAEAVRGRAEPGDVVAFASSVAAITEGRAVAAECIEPSLLARLLCRAVSRPKANPYGSGAPLANPLAFQVAVEMAGPTRILAAAAAGGLARLAGARGWFYSVAGADVQMIDCLSGIPPYDAFVIPGPYDCDGLAESIREAAGYEVAIVDAHDLGTATVAGASRGVDRQWVEAAMADNPAGNEDAMTPIVLLRAARTSRRLPSLI